MIDDPAPLGITPMEDRLRRLDPRVERVTAVIVKHLGTTTGYAQWSNTRTTFGEFWAWELIDADVDAKKRLGVTPDLERVARIKRNAQSLIEEINALSEPTQRSIELAKPSSGLNFGPHGYTAVLQSTSAELSRLLLVLENQARALRRLQSAKGRRNWRAASVACEARRVWAIAHWGDQEAVNSEDGNSTRFKLHLEECAPRTAKEGSTSPFAEFLEDVNFALGILTASGDAVSAKTALESLKSWQAKSEGPEQNRE